MQKLKSRLILVLTVVFLILSAWISVVNATATTYTTTSSINGVNVSWSYELNDSNEIVNLKCTNSKDLTGSITIPSTLDGKKVISLANEAFKSATSITAVTIPSTVKEIGLWAFSGCTNLSRVDLGNVEKISNFAFENCTSLTSIKIPKTLTKDASGAPFAGCTNLKSIELEEGMTVVPSCLCAETAITEITIPSTVKEIGHDAFKDCSKLKKITILDNVTKLGWFISNPTEDTVFTNHSDDLTIYCYEGSTVAQYAKNCNIKYVYLEKVSTDKNTNDDTKENPSNSTQTPKVDVKVDDTTTATGKIPQTGITMGISFAILVILAGCIFTYVKYNKLKDI